MSRSIESREGVGCESEESCDGGCTGVDGSDRTIADITRTAPTCTVLPGSLGASFAGLRGFEKRRPEFIGTPRLQCFGYRGERVDQSLITGFGVPDSHDRIAPVADSGGERLRRHALPRGVIETAEEEPEERSARTADLVEEHARQNRQRSAVAGGEFGLRESTSQGEVGTEVSIPDLLIEFVVVMLGEGGMIGERDDPGGSAEAMSVIGL